MVEILEGKVKEIMRCSWDIRFSIQNKKKEDIIKYCQEMQHRTSQIMAILDDTDSWVYNEHD